MTAAGSPVSVAWTRAGGISLTKTVPMSARSWACVRRRSSPVRRPLCQRARTTRPARVPSRVKARTGASTRTWARGARRAIRTAAAQSRAALARRRTSHASCFTAAVREVSTELVAFSSAVRLRAAWISRIRSSWDRVASLIGSSTQVSSAYRHRRSEPSSIDRSLRACTNMSWSPCPGARAPTT